MITSEFRNKCMADTQNYMYLGCTPEKIKQKVTSNNDNYSPI